MLKPKKRGPEPERLKISGDPGAALDRLLGKVPPAAPERVVSPKPKRKRRTRKP